MKTEEENCTVKNNFTSADVEILLLNMLVKKYNFM